MHRAQILGHIFEFVNSGCSRLGCLRRFMVDDIPDVPRLAQKGADLGFGIDDSCLLSRRIGDENFQD